MFYAYQDHSTMQPPLHREYPFVLLLIVMDVDHVGGEQTVQQCMPLYSNYSHKLYKKYMLIEFTPESAQNMCDLLQGRRDKHHL